MINVQQKAHLTGHKGSIYALSKGFQKGQFFSGDGNGWVAQWTVEQTDTAKVIAQVPSTIFALCPLPKQQLLAVGSMQGILYFIDLQANSVVPPSLQFSKSIFDLQLQNNSLYICGGDGLLSVMDIRTRTLTKNLPLSNNSLRSFALHPIVPNLAAVGSSDHHIYLVDLDKWTVVQRFKQHNNSVFSVQFSPDGQYLLSGSRDAHLGIFQANNQEKSHFSWQKSLPAHLFTINHIAFSSDQRYFATASRDKSLKIWSASDFSLLKVIDYTKPKINAHNHSVNKLLWLDNHTLLSASDDRSMMIWEILEFEKL